MDKFKDQDSMLPAATSDKKKNVVVKTGGKTQVIINPPEKVDPQRGYQERFKHALEKHSVIIEKKTELVLQSKAARADLPQETLEQVFKRGYKTFPSDSQLTREQYAMNRVNSFIAGGAAMVEDCDLLPIIERAGRPHVKQEKSPYNGKTIFHVIDAKGNIKHSTNDEGEARQHLARKFNTYLESTLSPTKRFEGTKSLVKTYKDDTPGEGKKDVVEAGEKMKGEDPCWKGYHMVGKKIKAGREVPNCVPKEEVEQIDELNKDTLHSYQAKADKQIVAKHRVLGPQIKAGDAKAANKTSAIIGKRMAGIDRAVERLNKEEVEQIDELSKDTLNSYIGKAKKVELRSMRSILARGKGTDLEKRQAGLKAARERIKEEATLSELSNAVLARYKAKAGEQASAADKAGDFKKGNKRFSGIIKATNKQFDNDIKGAK